MTELKTGYTSVHRRHLEFTYLYVMAETTQLMSFQELLFNVDTGYLEALVRGFRSGILTQSDYLNLSQCETLEGNDRIILVALCSSVSYQKIIFPFFITRLAS